MKNHFARMHQFLFKVGVAQDLALVQVIAIQDFDGNVDSFSCLFEFDANRVDSVDDSLSSL